MRRTPSGKRIAEVRLNIHDADYESSVAVVRNALGDEDFQCASTDTCRVWSIYLSENQKSGRGRGAPVDTGRCARRAATFSDGKRSVARQRGTAPR
jgi:hypothetical protein